MDMPPERIDVAFSIFDIDGELKITLSSVMNFVQHALKQVSEDEETEEESDATDTAAATDLRGRVGRQEEQRK